MLIFPKTGGTSTARGEERPYDYIVVGSGAGGGPLACNLAKAGFRVLVLEAGTDASRNFNTRVPTFHALSTEDPELQWDYFVDHYTDSARQREDTKFSEERGGILYPRAGTLGGCTAHNAMITVYPHNSDWDRLARVTGDSTWSARNMRHYFERLEDCRYGAGGRLKRFLRAATFGLFGNPSKHGYGGWLTTETADPTLAIRDKSLLRVIYEAGEQVVQTTRGGLFARLRSYKRIAKTALDPNDWRRVVERPEGLAFTPLATKHGERTSPREYLLRVRDALPDKLEIRTGALVSKVLFDEGQRAIGVEYLEGEHLYRADPSADGESEGGTPRQALARREVILAGGAFNTPQLLMLSGIGAAAELAKHGIDVRVDLPGVGANLQDRYEVCVVSEMKGNFALLESATFRPDRSDPNFREWETKRSGVYTTNGVVIGIIRRSAPERPDPDLYVFGIPGFFRGYFPGYSKAHSEDRNYFTWAILKGHTRNQSGRVTLRSADPRDVPSINFRYFDDDPAVGAERWEEDLASLAEGVQFVRGMNRDDDLQEIIAKEVVPGPDVATDADVKEFIKREAWGHHASCTCPIGANGDPLAVLDSDFRVRGTTGLRVVDASVFPRIPGLFIVSAVYMISEKAADAILADARSGSPVAAR